MPYDTAFRFCEALSPTTPQSLPNALHAVNAAVADCRNTGRSITTDPAIHLLIRKLAQIAVELEPDPGDLARRCTAAIAELHARPALLTLAGCDLAGLPEAKRSFHFQAGRALLRFAERLGQAEHECRISSALGSVQSSGETSLRLLDLFVTVVPRALVAGHELTFNRCVDGCDTGRPYHAPLVELLEPDKLILRLEHAPRPLAATALAA